MKSKEENHKLFNIILTRKRRKGRLVLLLRRLVRHEPILITITSSQRFGRSQTLLTLSHTLEIDCVEATSTMIVGHGFP